MKSTVKASTLLEVIVAMVIILVVFSLAIGIYTNVLGGADSAKKEKVNALIAHVISKSISENNWIDEQFDQDSIQLIKVVTNYAGFDDIILITVTAKEYGKEIGRLRQLVKKTSDEP